MLTVALEQVIERLAPDASAAQALIEFLDLADRKPVLTVVEARDDGSVDVFWSETGDLVASVSVADAVIHFQHPEPKSLVGSFGSHVRLDNDELVVTVRASNDVAVGSRILDACLIAAHTTGLLEGSESVGVFTKGDQQSDGSTVSALSEDGQPTMMPPSPTTGRSHVPQRQIPLDARSLTVEQVLGNTELKIPDFQRPYSWTEDQIKDLWDDVLDSARPGSTFPHFFGTLLTSPASEHPIDGNALDVLDGQQRLTTFTLLLIALDRHLEELDVPTASKRVREGTQASRERIGRLLKSESGSRRLRLRSEDDHLLANLVSGNPGDGAIGMAFTRLHDHVQNHLEGQEDGFAELERLTNAVLDGSVVIHANCRAGFDPFVVFSTLNATGLPLTASQILRARSLGQVNAYPAPIPSQTRSAWDAIEALGDDADKFLQAVLNLRTGERIQSKDVVRQFDREVLKSRSLGEVSDRDAHFSDLALELQRLVPTYRALNEGLWPPTCPTPDDWRVGRIRMLVRSLGIKQILPLLLAAAESARTQFVEIVDVVERASFVSLVCMDNQTRWGDTSFKLASQIYSGAADVDTLRRSVREFFARQLVDPAAVLEQRLPVQLRYNGRRQTLIRYFLTTINDWGYPSEQPWTEPDIQATWTLRDIHVDHIAALRGSGPILEGDRDRLGNLTPLKGKVNASLSNKPFPEKRDMYGESPLRITRGLKELGDWTIEDLESREASMTKFASALYCRDLAPLHVVESEASVD